MVYGSPAVRAGGSGRKYPGGASANHWKRWDAKPEATSGNNRSMPVRLRSGKPLETAGRKT